MTEPFQLLGEVVRPDGRVYRPRKPPAAVVVHDHHYDARWIYVLRTHEILRARTIAAALAQREGFDLDGATIARDWVHDGMLHGERYFFSNPVRGVPAVVFELDI